MKKLTRIMALLIAVLGLCFVVSAIEVQKSGDAGTVNIFVLNTGDIHEASGKLSKISEYIDQARREHGDHVLLLDAGDMLSKSTKAPRDWAGTKPKGDKMFEWASKMHYDAMVFGNHDFVGGVKYTQDLLQKYNLPFICANLSHPDLNVNKYKIIPMNIKLSNGKTATANVGVIGIADQSHKDYHHPNPQDKNRLKAYRVNNGTVKNLLKEVAGKSDFIILLSHNWDNVDKKYVASLPGGKIFVIVGGHSHKVLSESVKGKSLIKSGLEGNYIGSTMVTWDPVNHKVINVTAKNISM